MEDIPSRYIHQNLNREIVLSSVEARYYICLQITLGTISVEEICSKFFLQIAVLEDWILNYIPYDCDCGGCIIDDVGRSFLLEIVNSKSIEEEIIRNLIEIEIKKQISYSVERTRLRHTLMIQH